MSRHLAGSRRLDRRAVAVAAVAALIATTLVACGKEGGSTPGAQDGAVQGAATIELEPVVVVLPAQSDPEIIAGQAGTTMVNQYMAARLISDKFADLDFSADLDEGEVGQLIDDAIGAWENTQEVFDLSMAVLDAAVTELEAGLDQVDTGALDDLSFDDSAPAGYVEAEYASWSGSFLPAVEPALLPANSKSEAMAWAQKFTQEYDAMQGPKKLQQLAEQMNQDVRAVYDQFVLAQEILRDDALQSAARWDKLAKAAMAVKTASKVALVVAASTVAAPATAGELAALLATNIDLLAEVSATGSAIFLGENNKVTLAFEDVAKYTNVASTVLTFGTLKLADNVGNVESLGGILSDVVQAGTAVVVDRSDTTGDTSSKNGEGESAITVMTVDQSALEEAGKDENADLNRILEQVLEEAGIELPEGQPRSIDQVIEDLQKDQEKAVEQLEEALEQMGGVLVETVEEAKTAMTAALEGTYSWIVWGGASDWEAKARVSLSGSDMSIKVFDEGEDFAFLEGNFDAATGEFTSSNYYAVDVEGARIPIDGVRVNLQFEPYADTVTASGTSVSSVEGMDSSTANVKMNKLD